MSELVDRRYLRATVREVKDQVYDLQCDASSIHGHNRRVLLQKSVPQPVCTSKTKYWLRPLVSSSSSYPMAPSRNGAAEIPSVEPLLWMFMQIGLKWTKTHLRTDKLWGGLHAAEKETNSWDNTSERKDGQDLHIEKGNDKMVCAHFNNALFYDFFYLNLRFPALLWTDENKP